MKTYNISITDTTTMQNTTLTKVTPGGLKKLLTSLITDSTPGVKLLFQGKRSVKTSKTVSDKNYLNENNISLKD